MRAINFFDSVEYLEPKCPGCETVLDYGVNTKFDSRHKAHVCMKCGTALE